VQRHQARKFADRDAEVAAQRERAYEDQMAPPTPYPAPAPAPYPPAPGGGSDVIAQLKDLAQLREQGVLTDEEFAAQKARILG
jgi:hypothetical protein